MKSALLGSVSTARAAAEIASCFGWYYQQEVASTSYQGPLDFLRESAAQHLAAGQVIKASASRSVTIDRRNGYLQIDDSGGTDQILTMAIYRRADGSPLLVVGSSNCADACIFSVQFFAVSDGHLAVIGADAIVPPIAPAQFIKPGHRMPALLASIVPKVNYVPARVGTNLTVTPWYGYEAEAQMDSATRASIRTVTLAWNRDSGRFTESR